MWQNWKAPLYPPFLSYLWMKCFSYGFQRWNHMSNNCHKIFKLFCERRQTMMNFWRKNEKNFITNVNHVSKIWNFQKRSKLQCRTLCYKGNLCYSIFRNVVIDPQLQNFTKIFILRNFLNVTSEMEIIVLKLHFISFVQKQKKLLSMSKSIFS